MARYNITHVIDTLACDASVYKDRGFGPIETDKELLDWAEKASNRWFNAGWHHTFIGFYLGGYEFERKFTYKELVRLHELQDIQREEYNAKYEWIRFKGKPLTEEQIITFLDRQIEDAERHYGKDDYRYKSIVDSKQIKLDKWRKGEVIEVDSDCSAYDDRWLYSDGTIREQHWGD